jgi:hypothetical protein
VRKTAEAVLEFSGLKGAIVEVTPDGTRLSVQVPAAEVCAPVISRNVNGVISSLKRSTPGVVQIQMTIAGTKRSLADYVASSCRPTELPGVSGHLLLKESGPGMAPATTKEFRVRGRRWTLSYSSAGRFMQLLVFKGEAVQPPPLVLNENSAGHRTYRGPGRFKLQITAAGAWTVEASEK